MFLLIIGFAQAESTLLKSNNSNVDKTADALQGAADVVNTIKRDANRTIRVSINVIPSYSNKSVDNEQAAALIDDSAYHYELAVLFPSNKHDPLGLSKSVHAYFALHMLSYINGGENEAYWADHTEATVFAYGHRYYAEANYTGLGYGWYAGLALWENSDAYYWYTPTGTVYTDYVDDGIAPVVAGEIFYTYEKDQFFVSGRALLSINTENMGFNVSPQIMIGGQF